LLQFQVILVLALVAVAAAQYAVPYAGYNGLYRSGYYGSPYVAAPAVGYSGLGYRTYGAQAYGAYPTAYLG